jgi:hypothetical protein
MGKLMGKFAQQGALVDTGSLAGMQESCRMRLANDPKLLDSCLVCTDDRYSYPFVT